MRSNNKLDAYATKSVIIYYSGKKEKKTNSALLGYSVYHGTKNYYVKRTENHMWYQFISFLIFHYFDILKYV